MQRIFSYKIIFGLLCIIFPFAVSYAVSTGGIVPGYDLALDANDGRILWRPHLSQLLNAHQSTNGNSLQGATEITVTDTEITGVLWVEHPTHSFAMYLGGTDPGTCEWTGGPVGAPGQYPPCIGYGSVSNDGEGNLSGIITTPDGTTDFSTIRIDEHGYFHGTLLVNGTDAYRMNCQDDSTCNLYNFRVQTDWIPLSKRASFVGEVIISDAEVTAPTPKYYVVFTPETAIPMQGTVTFTFPVVYEAALALLEPEDVAISGINIENADIIIDSSKRRIIAHLDTIGDVTEEVTLVIGDGAPGGFEDLTNPQTSGLYGIGINIYNASDAEISTGIAYARISNSDVHVTASIMEALTVTINNTNIHFTLNPVLDFGQDRTQYTTFRIGTNSPLGYVIYGKLDDGTGTNQLRSQESGGTIPSGFGENTISYEAHNAPHDPDHEVIGDSTFAVDSTAMTTESSVLGNTSGGNNLEHTIYYHVDTDYMTPPGQYAAVLTYTIIPGF